MMRLPTRPSVRPIACLLVVCLLPLFAPALAQDGAPGETPAKPKLNSYQPNRETVLAASHVLIQWAGSERASSSITRSKDEALERARMVAAKAREGEAFAELAKAYSDGPSGPRGGSLGTFAPQQMIPAFSRAVVGLEVGQTSSPIESAFGYHVILREAVELVGARHVLVMHDESRRKPTGVSRTKEEALERARDVLRRARAGEDFATLAEQFSDGPTKTTGGDLGSFPRGRMVPAFDTAVFALEVGGVSEVVETPFGYHVILRYE